MRKNILEQTKLNFLVVTRQKSLPKKYYKICKIFCTFLYHKNFCKFWFSIYIQILAILRFNIYIYKIIFCWKIVALKPSLPALFSVRERQRRGKNRNSSIKKKNSERKIYLITLEVNINFIFSPKILLITFAVNLSKNKLMMICPYKRTITTPI